MYKLKTEMIYNRKCLGCDYCGWDAERQEERCFNLKCFEGRAFIEYNLDKYIEELKEKKRGR